MSTRGRTRPPFLVPQIEQDERPEQQLTAGVPLAKVITRKLSGIPEIVMVSMPRSAAAERFRRLKTSLINQSEGTPQVIVVTSPGQGEGKSLVATNLALAFAADRRGEVLLIDADLRRPSIGEWLSPAPKLGFSELAQQLAEIDHAVLSLEGTPLKVLPAGAPARDPAEMLASDPTKALLASLRDRYKTIIIDTPPIVPFTDADVIGSLSDGLLMLARSSVTQKSSFQRALSLVTSTRILGTVLNATVFNLADWNTPQAAEYDQYYYGKRKR
jgi:capsular exopolysaccharide synthesis family protein